MRYTDADIAQYGIGRVRTWIAEDQARYQAWRRDEWCFVDLRLVAVIEVFSGGQQIGALETDGPVLGGIESDSGDSYMNEVVGELADEFHNELAALGFSGLDATPLCSIAAEGQR
jgi:hypothetical protein